MNKEDYVTLEVAKLLKRKGFDEECELAYETDEEPAKLVVHCMPNHRLHNTDYACPILYEAQKWLRETKKIHICVDFNASGWYCRLYDILYGEFILQTGGYKDSYEETLNVGILEALKLI